MIAGQTSLHVTLLEKLLVIWFGLLLTKQLDRFCVGLSSLRKVLFGLVAVTNAQIPAKRVLVELKELLKVLQCQSKLLLQEQSLSTSQVCIWIVFERLNALLKILNRVLSLTETLMCDRQ